eukprot:CAMPEP_0167771166 /NCGR_PEP_ID=MMETSP0111_2-20121227/120_1 /TAXON_ID=91324 /ORGANISM="Lotharella globosa, Strain CCCM811" /LENGTH=289 /DNA_ID=CAMNT_0007660475 /DNA_START=39 /DNA_END=908 /DNA_ORIENTATION=-
MFSRFVSVVKRSNLRTFSKLSVSKASRASRPQMEGKKSGLLTFARLAGAVGIVAAVQSQVEAQSSFIPQQQQKRDRNIREEQRQMIRNYCNKLMSQGRLNELFVNASELERLFGMEEAVSYYKYAAQKGEPKSMITLALLDHREQSFWAYEAVKKGELIGQMLIPTLCDQKETRHHKKDLDRLNSRQYLDTPNKLMKIYTLISLSRQQGLSLSEKRNMIKEADEIMRGVRQGGDVGSRGTLTLFEAKLMVPLYARFQKLLRMKNPEIISACAPTLADIRNEHRGTHQQA